MQTDERLYDVCGTPGYLAPELLKYDKIFLICIKIENHFFAELVWWRGMSVMDTDMKLMSGPVEWFSTPCWLDFLLSGTGTQFLFNATDIILYGLSVLSVKDSSSYLAVLIVCSITIA